MTMKVTRSVSSFGVSPGESKSDDGVTPTDEGAKAGDAPANTAAAVVPDSVSEMWESIDPEVRAALIASELGKIASSSGSSDDSLGDLAKTYLRSESSTPTVSMSRVSSSVSLFERESSSLSGAGSSSSKDGEDESASSVRRETCPVSGADVILTPVERAPDNVYAFTKTRSSERSEVVRSSRGATVTTTTTRTVTTSRGWRNVFSLPISYDVNMVAHGTLFDAENSQLLDATGVHPEGYDTRFAVVDAEVDALYGDQIRGYFEAKGIKLTVCVINGGEPDKRPKAVDDILDELCAYKLRRREPFLAIGGGCVLDVAGMAACLYRRGVPFVRVPTTLLAIVDASVGVKNGVDYCCAVTDETYKNRVGSFYAPSACLLDPAFIASQDARNISNGFGEILKLALVRSSDLFDLLEAHGKTLVETRFEDEALKQSGVSSRIIDLSIQIMLEELGPNLWESKLDRCVDYGHTFSKLLEMVPGADIMHGEAVNVDGFFCVVISHLRGYIDMETVNRIFACMKSLKLPTNSSDLQLDLAWQSCKDAIEHRHGEQRIPLITEIGESVCASDITEEELARALDVMAQFDH